MRGLVFAVKELREEHKDKPLKSLSEYLNSKDLVLVSICFLHDSIRTEVPRAVKTLKKAGVTTRMITGDGYQTAKAIALESGIINEGENNAIISGS